MAVLLSTRYFHCLNRYHTTFLSDWWARSHSGCISQSWPASRCRFQRLRWTFCYGPFFIAISCSWTSSKEHLDWGKQLHHEWRSKSTRAICWEYFKSFGYLIFELLLQYPNIYVDCKNHKDLTPLHLWIDSMAKHRLQRLNYFCSILPVMLHLIVLHSCKESPESLSFCKRNQSTYRGFSYIFWAFCY